MQHTVTMADSLGLGQSCRLATGVGTESYAGTCHSWGAVHTADTSIDRGQVGWGASLAHRMDADNPYVVTASAPYAGGCKFTSRVGLAGEF